MTEESLLSQVRSGYGRKRKFFHNYQRSREFDYLDMVDAKKNRLTEELKDVKVSWSTVEELRSNVFDIPSFREGQGETIRRVLDGQSTLFISATGSGKSLTYLLPTVAMKNKGSITLVISPLLALIKDQLKSLPYCIRGACLSSEMNELEISEVNREVVKGSIDILYIAPERLFTASFLDLMKNVDRINLACIDEAHCASSWAHHFRPSYLRLGRFLTEKLKVRCILGLTATSTARVTNQICRLLFIPKDGVVYSSTIRPNLHVSVLRVNREVETLETIISSLPILFENSITSDIVEGQEKSPSFSTILYCSTQALCEKLATSLKKRGFRALPYHGAMKNQDRRANQDAFFSNEVQIIVATVAFGMGINKKDIRAVIHYNSPSSIEEWSQQIGRAGRDGKPSFCFTLLDNEDFVRSRSLSHSSVIEERSIEGIIRAIFEGGGSRAFRKRKGGGARQPPHSIVRLSPDLCRRLEIPPQTAETILAFLEIEGFIRVLYKAAEGIRMHVHGDLSVLKDDQYLKYIFRYGEEVNMTSSTFNNDNERVWKFDWEQIASKSGVPRDELEGHCRMKSIREHEQNFHFEERGSAWIIEIKMRNLEKRHLISNITQSIKSKMKELERMQEKHVDDLYELLDGSSHKIDFTSLSRLQNDPTFLSSRIASDIHNKIEKYFLSDRDEGQSVLESFQGEYPRYMQDPPSYQQVRERVYDLIQTMVRYSTIRITPLMICRVLHGISSPSCRRDIGVSIFAEYWGKMYNVDWNLIHICSSKVLNEPELIKALNGTRSLMLNEQATETRLKMIQNIFANTSEMSSSDEPMGVGRETIELSIPPLYTGGRNGNSREGLGIQRWEEEGESFIGEFKADLPDGCGRFIYSDGSVFEGQLLAGRPHGYGELKEEKRIYGGRWREGLPDGIGYILFARESTPGRRRYLVEMKEGKIEQVGTVTRAELEGKRWWKQLQEALGAAREAGRKALELWAKEKVQEMSSFPSAAV